MIWQVKVENQHSLQIGNCTVHQNGVFGLENDTTRDIGNGGFSANRGAVCLVHQMAFRDFIPNHTAIKEPTRSESVRSRSST